MYLKKKTSNLTNDNFKELNKIKPIKSLNNNFIHSFCLGLFIGMTIFIFIYGVKVLNFTYDEWLYNSGDLTQHYVGWTFFRNSPWTFPLGIINNYAYPFGVAITYTDSIPLFAILFKLLSPILPKTFQYFGFFQLISFMLHGGFAAIIIRKYIKNIYIIATATFLIVLSPILLRRVFIHTALSSHWLILFSISIWVYRNKFKSLKSKVIIWSFINTIAVLIHPYFVPMTLIMMLATLLADSLKLKTIKEALIVTICSLCCIVINFWIIGGFTGQSLEAYGLGRFSMNLNAFFDSNGWSKVFKDLPTIFPEQYEGFQYLGLGVILLIPIATILFIKNFVRKKYSLVGIIKNYFSLLIVIIPLTILALSTTIAINEKALLSYTLPKKIESVLSIFRSTGRLFWPVTYIVILFLIIYTAKSIKGKSPIFLLLFLCFVQFFDLNMVIRESQKHFKTYSSFDTILKSKLWDDVGKNYKHLMIIPAYDSTYSYFSKLANTYNMTLNTGSFARAPYDEINALADKTAQDLINGIYDKDTVYIIQKFGLVKEIMLKDVNKNFIVAKVDNTDNCFAIFSKDTKINFNNYPEIPLYTHDDFKTINIDDYFKYLETLPSGSSIIMSTFGKPKEFLTPEIFSKLNQLGFSISNSSLNDKSAYTAIKVINQDNFIKENINDESASIDYPVNSDLNGFKNQRIININGASTYSIMLLDGFQHSFDSYGLNFLIYDINNNKVLNSAVLDPSNKKIISMTWK